MNNALEQISSFAISGSLIASFVLGCFMAIQAMVFARNRLRFAILAILSFVFALLDMSHSYFSASTYETLRMVVWSTYGPTVFFVFGGSARFLLLCSILLAGIGTFVFCFIDPGLATTTVLPLTFGLAAVAHARQFRASLAFGSCVLLATSLSQALACATYFWIMQIGSPWITLLGYAHYAGVSLCAVLFGWVHVPREMALGVPVKITASQGRIFLSTFVISELFVMPPFLFTGESGSGYLWYISANIVQASALLLLYFYHRHQLVVYTDNVAQLLDERTASLRLAQEELAKQNDIQHEKLVEQEAELRMKSQVIKRQSRLELAAQTAGQAAHDIQNLLTPFVIYLDRLSKVGSDQNRLAQVLDVLRTSTDDLLNLNGQLLALARRGRVERESVSIASLMEEVLKQHPEIVPVTTVTIDPNLSLQGAPFQLRRAFSNILVNAFEADPVHPRIRVQAERKTVEKSRPAHLGFLQPGEYTVITIADRGTGIAPGALERMFEPFYSTKGSGSRSGSGLGLSIVAGVIEDHKGVIDVITSADGTEFIIYFPFLASSETVGVSEFDAQAAPILVIGNHSERLEAVRNLLRETSLRFIIADQERTVFSQMIEQKIDLLIVIADGYSDSGADLFFKAMHLRSGVKAIVSGDYISESHAQRLKQLGVQHIFSGEFSAENLLAALKESLVDQTDHRITQLP